MMSKLENYCIPEEIWRMELYKDQYVESRYDELMKKPIKTVDDYVNKFEKLIYMEEAANLSKLKEYDLENVQIATNSTDQTFTVVIFPRIFHAILYF